MTRIFFGLNDQELQDATSQSDLQVLLYGPHTAVLGAGLVGNRVKESFFKLSVPPPPFAMDLVTVALAVTAADTFVFRQETADGWRREIELVVPVSDPARWSALSQALEQTLSFLSGDSWSFSFHRGGFQRPFPSEVRHRNGYDPTKIDAVALFSGGLDSALGVLDLHDGGIRPLLVSHAPRGDSSYQDMISRLLPWQPQRLTFNSYPSWSLPHTEITTRTRSLLFLSFAAMAADAVGKVRGQATIDLYICENGLIALNPPLTDRRIGALSTRTAHPHYLAGVQALLDALGMGVVIKNPHRHETKGEMLKRRASHPATQKFASHTVSCGNWKRKGIQCGRCWPCLIRRASFHHAQVTDDTPYETMQIRGVLQNPDLSDDVVSVHSALVRRYERKLEAWVMKSGPLPSDPAERKALYGVVERGMDELELYFTSQGLPT